MAKYSLSAIDHTTATALLQACQITAAATEEAEVIEMTATGSGITAAADTMHTMRGTRNVNGTAGTSTGQTPVEWNENGPAALMAGTVLYTVITAVLDTVHEVMYGFNQRGGMRWAVPRGEGIRVNGDQTKLAYNMGIISSAAGKIDANMHWWEP